ncbi:type 11 methyltransferase [Candidatus Magnetomorum sp. HK-1]|nr:type 11 methyltransferase [Candidatus Magnetomorum sp. HK-1]
MNLKKYIEIYRNAFGRGIFPHEMSWFLDMPGRGFIMSAKTVANRLPVASDAIVLEIGPGSGYYSAEVAKKLVHGRLEILDIQKEMLYKCQCRLDRAGVKNYSVNLGNGKTLPFSDNVFDAIYMVTVFGEIERRQEFLEESSRVLKPNGFLSITEHHPDPDFEHADVLQQEVEKHGFVLIQKLGWRWAYTANFSNMASDQS